MSAFGPLMRSVRPARIARSFPGRARSPRFGVPRRPTSMRRRDFSTSAEWSTGLSGVGALGLSFLAFFDPDGIALELTAPISDTS